MGEALVATRAPGSGASKSWAMVGPPGHAGSAVKLPEDALVDASEVSRERYEMVDSVTETLHAAISAVPNMVRPGWLFIDAPASRSDGSYGSEKVFLLRRQGVQT